MGEVESEPERSVFAERRGRRLDGAFDGWGHGRVAPQKRSAHGSIRRVSLFLPLVVASAFMATTDKFTSWLTSELQQIRDSGMYKEERVIVSPQSSFVSTTSGEAINMCANNYLGLADNRDIVEASIKGLKEKGFGMASVRFICGTQDLHKTLERRIAAFLGTEDAILYTSCFDANGGLFETLLGPEDCVISDALNHASIIDGVRLCKAERKIYQHLDMADLEARLKEALGEPFPHDRDRRCIQHARRPGASPRYLQPGSEV